MAGQRPESGRWPASGMRKENSPFPTQQGTALAKDVWMMGIGLGLLIDDLTDRPGESDL